MARILIAEDTQYIQYLLKQILADQGHQLHSAEDGNQALKILAEFPVDLLLLDLHLPDMDGIQVIEEVHQTRPKIPFLVLSGFVDADIEIRLWQMGVSRILTKPVSREDLLESTERALRSARRILLVTEDPPALAHLEQQLTRLGYLVEVWWQLEWTEFQIMHRSFDALILWGEWTQGGKALELCQRLRARNEWLPIFLPQKEQPPDSEDKDLFFIPDEDPAHDLLYTLLSRQIGLQRETRMNDMTLIQLAGSIDREDVFRAAIREAITQRQNILLDLRRITYLGAYVNRSIRELGEEAVQLHLKVGLLVPESDKIVPYRDWTRGDDTVFLIFSNELEAMKAMSSRRQGSL